MTLNTGFKQNNYIVRWHHNTTKSMLQKQRVLIKCTSFTWESELWKKYLQFPWIVYKLVGKKLKIQKKNLCTWVKALICKWSSYWKHIENGFSKQDAAWGLKPVELTVHISKGCVCFLFTALYIVHRSLYHMHLKIKMCMKAKSPSNVKREKAFIFLSPFSREL